MARPELVVHPTADALADAVAAELLAVLPAAQAGGRRAALALTAGSIMERVWGALAARPQDAVDWSRVDVFWGDERFVPHDSPDRNDVPAERILFAGAPFSAATRYSMPASDGEYGEDLDAAAAGYSRTLQEARRPDDTGTVPSFDVVLLGVGPDGHCCSLFPNHPGTRDESQPVIAVRNSPKPPPLRMSFTFDTLNSAAQIWVVASGSGKADAVAKALDPATDREQVPSAGARGRSRTVWFVDQDAAPGEPG